MNTLADILRPSDLKAPPQKLAKLTQLLEEACGAACDEIPANDPFVLRRCLVAQMKAEGHSQGVVQAFEQFFMGVVRRAAIEGIIPAPPEGPWTQSWQAVLEFTAEINGAKSAVRQLAAWASDQGIEPNGIATHHLLLWKSAVSATTAVVAELESVVVQFRRSSHRVDGDKLTQRLLKKATSGSVRVERG